MAAWDFRGKIAVIVGGTGGLGRALTGSLVQSGARVYALGLEDHHLQATRAELEQLEVSEHTPGGSWQLIGVDVRDIPGLTAELGAIVESETKVDILVNAAGICPIQDLEEIDEQTWDRVMDINLKSVWFTCRAIVPTMKKHNQGAIINIGSTAGYNGGVIPSAPYGASKAAVHSLSKWLASRYSQFGIRVNSVAPGPFESEMISVYDQDALGRMKQNTPNRKLGRPEDVVQSILFLADEEASGHITGASLDVCGGQYLR